jgi:hypothetical protein
VVEHCGPRLGVETKLSVGPVSLVVVTAGGLPSKLIHWKREKLEALLMVFVIEHPQRRVVAVLDGSIRRYIHDNADVDAELG